jgi:hypothetical protein
MKKVISILMVASLLAAACKSTGSLDNVKPKEGIISLPANGELRIWNNIEHPSFTVNLTNAAKNQSCEVYKVKSNGKEKWISPSLLANSTMSISVPANGHLYFKNFNPNVLEINYSIK